MTAPEHRRPHPTSLLRLPRRAHAPSIVSRARDRWYEQWVPLGLALATEWLLVELADGLRVGDAVVGDARLPDEIFDTSRRAA